MLDRIPIEIQMDIIHRIPDIKWVIQFRSVSKAWKSIIDSKEFVAAHTLRHIQQQRRHLLIRGRDSGYPPKEVRYVSIVDDDTFPHQKFNLFPPDFCKIATLVGSSHGLFCLFVYNKKMVVIWNPLIRKSIVTVLPVESRKLHLISVGFGVCPNTLDPKLVMIQNNKDYAQVEVFTLSSRAWRGPLSNTCPRKSISLGSSQAVVDGFIYWYATDRIKVDGLCRYDTLIMSFDLTVEEFTELYLPNSRDHYLLLSNLRESLGVVEFIRTSHIDDFNIWIMKGRGCTRSFEKLYSISTSDVSIEKTLGFRRSGAPVIEIENDAKKLPATLAVYDPESKDITEIWSNGITGSFCVHSYMETLLLLDY